MIIQLNLLTDEAKASAVPIPLEAESKANPLPAPTRAPKPTIRKSRSKRQGSKTYSEGGFQIHILEKDWEQAACEELKIIDSGIHKGPVQFCPEAA